MTLAKLAMDSLLDKSNGSTNNVAPVPPSRRICSTAFSPLSRDRQAKTTVMSYCTANVFAVSYPIPVFAPVTMASLLDNGRAGKGVMGGLAREDVYAQR
eukprot:scaffold5383_cov222-Amphora_coffeaeformis.AAC.7